MNEALRVALAAADCESSCEGCVRCETVADIRTTLADAPAGEPDAWGLTAADGRVAYTSIHRQEIENWIPVYDTDFPDGAPWRVTALRAEEG